MSLLAFSRTDAVDHLVTEAAQSLLWGHTDQPFAVLAVGGYGRRELFPYSDVDIILLLRDEPQTAALKEPLSQFLRHLWDSSVKASQSVRTVAECCRLHDTNIHLNISLLDLRFVCGEREIFDELTPRLAAFFERQGPKILEHLTALTAERHASFGNTVYHLEPNVKEGPGGIRDIHFLHWAALLAPSKEPLRLASANLEPSRDFLHEVRVFIHEKTGRDNNLLSFELQDQAAVALSPRAVPPEDWMRVYYRHARAVYQSCLRSMEFLALKESNLLRGFLDRRGRFSTADYTVSHNRVFLRNPAAVLSSLASVFDLFIFVARQGIPLSWDAQRRLCEHAPDLRSTALGEPLTWRNWHELLSQPHAALALHEMENVGVLSAAFAEWETIESLVVRDFYHRYTVDEHTLVAIEAIDNLLSNPPGTPPRFRELALEEENLAVVRMALLLHDIGKGTTPGDHVRGSAETASDLLTRLETPDADKQIILFLIAHHLDLSLVMNGRDLDDPATARFLSLTLGTPEDLRKLTLLTYADVSAVNPTAMTPWRSEQLRRVYSVGLSQFTRELDSDRIHQGSPSNFLPYRAQGQAEFLEGFPTRYLRIHTPEQIEQHFLLEQKRQSTGVGLAIHPEAGVFVLTVLAGDQPGLFAALCGTLASFGMNIVKAEAASNANGCVLDELRFSDPNRTLELNPDEIERLLWTVECVVRGAINVTDLLKRRRPIPRPRTASPIAQSVRFDNSASESATLIDFVGEDRPGLLFDLSSRLTDAGCNIEVVLVNTEAHRAVDSFYVTHEGAKLDGSLQADLRARLTRDLTPEVSAKI